MDLRLFLVISDIISRGISHADPAILWQTWNPVYACDQQTLHVRMASFIRFWCPQNGHYLFIPPYSGYDFVFEELYFLGENKEKYDTCDFRNGHPLLKCKNFAHTRKLYNLALKNYSTHPGALKFQEGRSYYLIGTGSETIFKNNVFQSNKCVQSDTQRPRIRLKISICQKNKPCPSCSTEACRLRQCKSSCSKWNQITSIKADKYCTKVQTRECFYPHLTQPNQTEYMKTKVKCSASLYQNKPDEDANEKYLYYVMIGLATIFGITCILLSVYLLRILLN